MLPEWTGEAVKKMHLYGISEIEISSVCSFSRQYVNRLLNGKSLSVNGRKAVEAAIESIVERRGAN